MNKTVANQKIIKINKVASNKTNIYGIVNKDCMYKAMDKLTYNEFKIYMYMITNQNNYEFALSTKDIADKTGANQRELQKCINSLINKKYLVQESGNQYIFNESCSVGKQHSVETTVLENNVGVCGKTTEGSVGKQHSTAWENNIEILQDNTNNITTNNTESDKQIDSYPKTDNLNLSDYTTFPDDLKLQIQNLYKKGYKYNKDNPEIQNEIGMNINGKVIFNLLNDMKSNPVVHIYQQPTLSWTGKDGSILSINTSIVCDEVSLNECSPDDVYSDYIETIIKEGCPEKEANQWFLDNFNYDISVNK